MFLSAELRSCWLSRCTTHSAAPGSLLPTASSRPAFLRARHDLLRNVVLRNENFTPPLLFGDPKKPEREGFMKVSLKSFAVQGNLRDLEGKRCVVKFRNEKMFEWRVLWRMYAESHKQASHSAAYCYPDGLRRRADGQGQILKRKLHSPFITTSR